MGEGLEIVRAQLPAAGPTESSETRVYTASHDVLIANVVFTPAADVRGDWDRPRYMQLRVGSSDKPGDWYVADASAQRSAFYLPARVAQSATLVWSERLRVRAGETLYWSSFVVRGEQVVDGIPDPGGDVEVLLEPAEANESAPGRPVPEYWRGRTVGIEHMLSKAPPGGGTAYYAEHVGRFVEAADGGIALEVETPQTLGVDRETYEIPYDRIMHIRLL